MRLPLVLAALAVSAPAGSAGPAPAADMPVFKPPPLASEARDCPPTSRYHAAKRSGGLKAQKLTELPMADAYAAVYRRIGRCEVPIIVRYGIGGNQR